MSATVSNGEDAMRLAWMLAAGVALGSAGAEAATLDDFQVNSTRQLVALCSVTPSDTYYVDAIQFCYGFLSGAYQFHNAVVSHGGIKRLACPAKVPSREEFATYFAQWARSAPPEVMDEPAVEGLARAAAARWPCPR